VNPAGLVSVVIPAHNESGGIATTLEEIRAVLASTGHPWEIIVVDDGSTDDTFGRVHQLMARLEGLKAARLSRNFGKEAAILAGLVLAKGHAVITIDADLQHPPAVIPALIGQWQAGAKVVNAVKRTRKSDSAVTRARAALFNAIMAKFAGIGLENASDFKLLDRVVVDRLTRDFPERTRFYRGLTDWIGYPQAEVEFDVEPRRNGTSRWSLRGLIRLALTSIIGFTAAPLRVVTLLGGATLLFGFALATDAVISWSRGRSVSGFATTIIAISVIGSFIMLSLGVIGEYLARMFDELKRRPSFIFENLAGFEPDEPRLPEAPLPLHYQSWRQPGS
jgi:glycosyltransferase involved in cell wall biosynthesis